MDGPIVRESYEEKDVSHLEGIYGLPNIGVVGHVECPVTSATSQKMVTVLGATVLIIQKRKKQGEKFESMTKEIEKDKRIGMKRNDISLDEGE